MKIDAVGKKDVVVWMDLAKEVEPLFGPMVGQDDFHAAMKEIISSQNAFCTRNENGQPLGIIAVAPEQNEILWLAVAHAARGYGIGKELLAHAIDCLDAKRPIRVQTFAAGVPSGTGARKLYLNAGFVDIADGGLNPAGLPTVWMEKK